MGKIVTTLLLGDIAATVASNPYIAGVEIADWLAWVKDMGIIWIAEILARPYMVVAFIGGIPALCGVWVICKAVVDSAKEMRRYKL